jgi:hypothetical protein
MDTPPTLEEVFADTATADTNKKPISIARADLEALIQSMLADPDVLDPPSASASAHQTLMPERVFVTY